MDPNRYINERITSKEPVQSAAPINKEVKASIPTNNTANIHRKPPQKENRQTMHFE